MKFKTCRIKARSKADKNMTKLYDPVDSVKVLHQGPKKKRIAREVGFVEHIKKTSQSRTKR